MQRTLYVVSFRYSDNPANLIGGDGAFLNQLLPHLGGHDDWKVVVLSLLHKGADDISSDKGFQVVRFGVLGSEKMGLVELHQLPEPEILRIGQRFAESAFRYIQKEARQGDACLLNDFVESGDLKLLLGRGLKLIQVCHILASEYLFREYMSDRFSGEAKDMKRRLGSLVYLINGASRVIRTHKQLVGFFGFLIDRGLDRALPRTIRIPFARERQSILNSDVILVPTETMKQKILSCYPVPAGRILVHPWCVESPPSRKELALELSKLRTEFNLRDDDQVLLTLSRISPEKGIEFLIDALAILEKKAPYLASKLVLFVCGRATLSRGEAYLSDLRKRAARLSQVRVFFPGFVTGARKSAFFYSSDIYVMPSKYESFGLTLLEAMSHGAAVLASETDGSKDLVDAAFGTVLPFEEVEKRAEQIADALFELCSKDTRAMGALAVKKSEAYRWPRLAETLLSSVEVPGVEEPNVEEPSSWT